MKKVIILPNEKIYNVPNYIKTCRQFHKDELIKFIDEVGLSIPEIRNMNITGQEIAYSLVDFGFCVMFYDITDEINCLVIYMPYKISDNQCKYFKRFEKELNNFEINIAAINNEGLFDIIDKTNTPKPIMEALNDLLEERHYTINQNDNDTKIKIKKPENNQ